MNVCDHRAVTARSGMVVASAALVAGLAASSAHAQEAFVSAESEMEMMPELPNHPRGERERSAPAAEAPSATGAETETEARDWFGHKAWWEWETMTGDWGGARKTLEDAGFSIGASYTFDWTSVWSGGVRNVASTRSLFDVTLSVDMEKLVGLKGGTFFFDFYSTDGRGQEDVGDIQAFDNIMTDANLDQIAEVWYEQKLFGDVVRVKFGKVDVNSEFGFPIVGADFIHSSAAYSPTSGAVFTTYPNPATSVNVFAYPTEWWYIGAAMYDGAGGDGIMTGGRGPATFFSDDKSSDWFLIAETGASWKNLFGADAAHGLRGRCAIGAWHHTGDFARFDGGTESDGSTGFYALVEQRILSRAAADGASAEAGEEDDLRGLWIFAQYGHADGEVMEIENHVGVGVALLGTFGGRDDDSAGVYVSWADLSDAPEAGFSEDETALEFFYKVQLTPFMSVRPDLQVIWNPSGDAEIDTAVVGGVRLEVTF